MALKEDIIEKVNFTTEDKLKSVVPSDTGTLADPDDTLAKTKEEEWVTKKKIELTTTKQIKTRVKRQVVLEDGKIVEDSGPMVTTDTTEDTEKQEHSQTERRALGDDDVEQTIATSNPEGHVKEVQEKTIRSREEKEERMETESVQHLGDISDEGYMTAVKSGSNDIRQALELSNRTDLVEVLPKTIHQSIKTKKYIDSEDKTQLSKIQPGGKIVNETRTTRVHEELGDCNVSDNGSTSSQSFYETKKTQRHRKVKDQDLTEYLVNGQKVGEKVNFQTETVEGERMGDPFEMNDEMNLSSRLMKIRMNSEKNRLAIDDDYGNRSHLTKKSTSFDDEEKTRKEETSKWLEYHFGSESTKSSKASNEDLENIVPSTQNSFISVTMKSQPVKKPLKSKYMPVETNVKRHVYSPNESSFYSNRSDYSNEPVSRWSERKDERILDSTSPSRGISKAFFDDPYNSMERKPRQANKSLSHSTILTKTRSEDSRSPTFEPIHVKTYDYEGNRIQTPSPYYQYSDDHLSDINEISGPYKKTQRNVLENEQKMYPGRNVGDVSRRIIYDLKEDEFQIPVSKDENTTAFHLPSNKKLYQRTRFAADIPPPPQIKQEPVKGKNKIGESFRKLVGKLRSSSSDRKNKKKSKNRGSRSPSPKENSYQNYNSLDQYGSLINRSGDELEEPTAPPRTKYVNNRTRTLAPREKTVQKYYLGENPFSGSIYGQEKEYDNKISNSKIKTRRRPETDTDGESDFKSRTLSKFSKSTSRLNPEVMNESYSYDRRGVQTLPRKFRNENTKNKIMNSKLVRETESAEEVDSVPHTRSMINVSFVNQPNLSSSMNSSKVSLRGPVKPARTYRSSLSRSQSFNVQPGEKVYLDPYQSKSRLHRLEESPPPLESPTMISHWRQSPNSQDDERFKSDLKINKKEVFMKNLHDTAPELYRTLHGDGEVYMSDGGHYSVERKKYPNYSNSFRSTSTVKTNNSNTTVEALKRSPLRQGYMKNSYSPISSEVLKTENGIITVSRQKEDLGNDDYAETVRIESKSDDPRNPSKTNTVKTFTKKKIPSKGGSTTETIETTETKTVFKSHPYNEDFDRDRIMYNRSPRANSGVVIKVKNDRY